MAWTWQATNTAGNGLGTNLAVTRPTTVADDWFVLDVYLEDNTLPTLSFSNGTWTLVKSGAQTGSVTNFTHYKYISRYVSEGSTFTISWTGSGNNWRTAVLSAYRGGSSGTAQDGTPTTHVSTTATATVSYDTITTANASSLVLYGEANYDGSTNGVPGGTTPTFTERAGFGNIAHGDGILATAGATGAKTSTLSLAAWNNGILMGLALPTGGAAQNLNPLGIPTAERFGVAVAGFQLLPSGIVTAEQFGLPGIGFQLLPSGIVSAERFGTGSLGLQLQPTGISSAETLGAALAGFGILASGISSAEQFGNPAAGMFLAPSGIPSAELFGTPATGLFLTPAGIASLEALGSIQAGQGIALIGIPGAEGFGLAALSPGPVSVLPVGIPSAEGVGIFAVTQPSLPQTVLCFGIPSSELFGQALAFKTMYGGLDSQVVFISPSGRVVRTNSLDSLINRLGIDASLRRV